MTAAKATFALNAGECIRRLFFVIFAPDSRQESSPLSGRKSTQATVRICGASSGATAIEIPERGLFGVFFSGVGKCSDAEFREAGLAVASIDKWVIDYMSTQSFIKRNEVIIVGQSGGGWGAIALGSQNPKSVRAIIGFAAGRGGHFNGKPNNNCAPDKLVDAVAEFGRTARVPMLWIYTRNDSYFGPDLSKRMSEAFRAAGGNVEYRLLSDFGGDGHFLIDSADAVQLWAPIVSEFLAKHP
ncbi:hypothetical protein HAP48_0039325 [Bradyrhizobium septentrionale]|uniref:Dienelactone hydrolase domain-containing protein n=1 Tax=Bradyrhizobium septentrionale TaxID=1404411 RepID=A0A974A2B7_9BRAD|nr:hypothetical protein [Bradyrhizobium septentrionale]UGY14540.1 hypothetical protein HAP48_0039325 [Bradyrhizobium septentrionale]